MTTTALIVASAVAGFAVGAGLVWVAVWMILVAIDGRTHGSCGDGQ